ncbi:MAG: hypothetical protein VZR02_04065 [Lachnospiraceae bacterium]|nr:hypothetical protein [Lachnospiraceae bacterium]
MAYRDFTEAFTAKGELEGSDFLEKLMNHLYTEDFILGGQTYTCRRVRDEVIDEEKRLVRTDFFCFPQNGDKHRMEMGGTASLIGTADALDAKAPSFSDIRIDGFIRPTKERIYRSVVADRARKLLKREETETFLLHNVFVTTPRGARILLEDFPFEKEEHKLFMLGLYGGEYKISISRK